MTSFPYIFAPTLFINFSVAIAILLTMAKLNVNLKLELVSINTSPLAGKMVHNNKKSSVKDHCLLSGHVCSFDDFTVLNYESHKFKRLIKESLLVTKDKQLLNKQVTSLKLELFLFNSAYMFSCEFCKISKNTFSYRTPPVAASGEYPFVQTQPWSLQWHVAVIFALFLFSVCSAIYRNYYFV